MVKRICDLISSFMGVIILLSAVLALYFPSYFSFLSPSIINPMLGVVMLGMGLTLNPSDFKTVFSRPKDVIAGCAAQFVVMPLLALLLTKGETVDVDVVSMFLSIFFVVILPVALGLTIQRFLPRFTKVVSTYLPSFSVLVIALIVMIVVSLNSAKLLSCGALVVLVVVLHNIMGLALGYAVAKLLRMSGAKSKAVSIEVGMQNSGLASSLALTSFAQYPLAAVPGAVFSVWHNISGAIVARVYSSISDKDGDKK